MQHAPLRAIRPAFAAILSGTLASCVLAASAAAADWLPAFDLGGTSPRKVSMTPAGDIAFTLNTTPGARLRFRPAGGPLGPLEQPFPAGANGTDSDIDGQANTYLVWTRAGTLEARVRMRDGSLTPIQTVQTGVLAGHVAVSRSGRATFTWITSDAARSGGARTRATDGTLGPVQAVTVAAEKTRNLEVDVAGDGDATFVWTTPEGPPNTKVKARTLDFASQTLSTVYPLSTPPAGELSDMPQVAVDPAGNARFVWRHTGPGPSFQSMIETELLSAAGTLSAFQTLTSSGSSGQGHALGMADNGSARMVWVEHATGGMDPLLPKTCFTGLTSSCGALLTLSTSQSLSASVGVGPAQDAMVGWASPNGQVRVLPRPGGAPVPTHVLSPNATVPLLAVDGEGNGVAVWQDGGLGPPKAAGFDALPPVLKSVSVPSVAERAVPMAASVSVRDVWGTIDAWAFGDGGTAKGRSVRHAYRRNGTYRVQVTATDGTGARVSAARTVTVRDTRAPFLGRVTMKRRRFRVATRKRPRRGSNFRFALGEDATVFIKIQRRRKGGKRFVSAGRRLRRKLTAGRKRVKFSGRIGRRALRPGRYRANLRAVDASSNRSRLRRVRFVIVR